MRYSFDDGVLNIESDTPNIKSYKFNYLDIVRNSTSSIQTDFQVGNAGGGGGDQAATAQTTTGSNTTLNSNSGEGDLWTNITAGVESIITGYQGEGNQADNSRGESKIMSINNNSGMVSVLATERQHKEIKEYLDALHINLTSQVLIEAKVMEVTLKDEYSSGIDWSVVSNGIGGGVFSSTNFGGLDLSRNLLGIDGNITVPSDKYKIGLLPTRLFGSDNNTISASVELLQTFGVTRSLSNPRINALNNQSAILNFTQNEVYFDVDLAREEQDATDNSPERITFTVESEIRTVPVGVVLALQPSIDLEQQEILMSIRPTLTRVDNRIADPAIDLFGAVNGLDTSNLNSEIPIVKTRELDTLLRINSGEIMVIGGLLEERTVNTDVGVPGLSEIPYLGNAFKSVTKSIDNVETVIFIKATIVPGRGVAVEDKKFYNKYSSE